jgi:hypothetical protein
VELGGQHPQLLRLDGGAPLVDLGERARRRIDDRDRRARLVGDADEVAEDSLEAEILDDALSGAAAGETGRDHRSLQRSQRPRDVEPLAARAREAVARTVPVTELEVRNGQSAVDRGVEGYGDDHCRCTTRERRLLDADLLTDAKGGRIDAVVELFEPGDRRACLARDRGERVPGLDRVGLHAVPLVSVMRVLPLGGDGRRRRIGVMLPVL